MGLFASPEEQLRKKEAQLKLLKVNSQVETEKQRQKMIKKRKYDVDMQRLTA